MSDPEGTSPLSALANDCHQELKELVAVQIDKYNITRKAGRIMNTLVNTMPLVKRELMNLQKAIQRGIRVGSGIHSVPYFLTIRCDVDVAIATLLRDLATTH